MRFRWTFGQFYFYISYLNVNIISFLHRVSNTAANLALEYCLPEKNKNNKIIGTADEVF